MRRLRRLSVTLAFGATVGSSFTNSVLIPIPIERTPRRRRPLVVFVIAMVVMIVGTVAIAVSLLSGAYGENSGRDILVVGIGLFSFGSLGLLGWCIARRVMHW